MYEHQVNSFARFALFNVVMFFVKLFVVLARNCVGVDSINLGCGVLSCSEILCFVNTTIICHASCSDFFFIGQRLNDRHYL